MKLLRTGILSAIVAVTLLASAPAMADPPPSNPNTNVLTFDCSRDQRRGPSRQWGSCRACRSPASGWMETA